WATSWRTRSGWSPTTCRWMRWRGSSRSTCSTAWARRRCRRRCSRRTTCCAEPRPGQSVRPAEAMRGVSFQPCKEPSMSYPLIRPRRMRRDEFSRRLMRENVLTANDLIYPVFVHEEQGRAPVPSMPGVERLSIDELLRVAEQALELGVPVLDLFGVPDPSAKTADGRIAWDPDGIIPRAIRALKSRFPELGV